MSQGRFRQAMLAFSLVLGFHAIWIVLPELIRPGAIHLPLSPQAAALVQPQRSRTLLAASLGFVRGDLWADSAFTYSELIWMGDPGDTNRVAPEARAKAERALSYSPHRSDVWLFLAALAYRFNSPESRVVSALKLSYYTGTNETTLMPLRLFLSLASQMLVDTELQEMVRRDIHIIMTRKPELKPALTTAYKNASLANKSFAEAAINEADPAFLASIRDRIR
jgi:hypothetical protein